MFQKTFQFTNHSPQDTTDVTPTTLYSFEQGYGFLTEENCLEHELLQIPELNNGFEVWHWYIGQKLIEINQDDCGCFLSHTETLPLSFKASVPSAGNYKVTLTITASNEPINDLTVFTGRRRLALHNKHLEAFETITLETIVNVCDYIPRGKEVSYTDHSICITVIGHTPRIAQIHIEEINVPTIYIAGDSTLTDQTGAYPYIPENCYCGWGQFLTFFLNNKVAVCNQAHSGLTTESFRSEGHYSIIENNIKAGDFFFLQFGHNDQKLSHLTAGGGYKENVLTYIKEIRKKGAFPVLVTPLCRNTWKGADGTYNDLLEEYNHIIIAIGEEQKVPVIHLHQKSYDLINQIGLEDAKRYFFPGDYTHTNDYGAYQMASYIAEGFTSINELQSFLDKEQIEWIPPIKVELITSPKGFEAKTVSPASSFNVAFTDIEDCDNKEQIVELTALGIIPNTETTFRPKDIITRAEALNMTMKTVNFFPTNVYNDMFEDIVGHEWYAGTIECAWANGMVDKALVDKKFYPQKEVTYEEMISFLVNAYKSRKTLPDKTETTLSHCSDWAKPYYNAANSLSLLNLSTSSSQLLTRQEAANLIYALKTLL